ncbi:MAG: hypothetical protein AAF579_06950 [Cyanobacteria bacterium P01_C01_bin.118]
MKRSINVISEVIAAISYLPLFGSLVLFGQCLSHIPAVGDIWPKAIDGNDSERLDALLRSLITDSRLELNRYKRSGGCRHLAMLPT